MRPPRATSRACCRRPRRTCSRAGRGDGRAAPTGRRSRCPPAARRTVPDGRLGDARHEEQFLAEQGGRHLEEQPTTDAMRLDQPGARPRSGRDDAVVGSRGWIRGGSASLRRGSGPRGVPWRRVLRRARRSRRGHVRRCRRRSPGAGGKGEHGEGKRGSEGAAHHDPDGEEMRELTDGSGGAEAPRPDHFPRGMQTS